VSMDYRLERNRRLDPGQSCQLPVSRQTGQARSSTHMDCYGVYQALASYFCTIPSPRSLLISGKRHLKPCGREAVFVI
jgi:hypothetical protein